MASGPSSNVSATRFPVAGPRRIRPGTRSNTSSLIRARAGVTPGKYGVFGLPTRTADAAVRPAGVAGDRCRFRPTPRTWERAYGSQHEAPMSRSLLAAGVVIALSATQAAVAHAAPKPVTVFLERGGKLVEHEGEEVSIPK